MHRRILRICSVPAARTVAQHQAQAVLRFIGLGLALRGSWPATISPPSRGIWPTPAGGGRRLASIRPRSPPEYEGPTTLRPDLLCQVLKQAPQRLGGVSGRRLACISQMQKGSEGSGVSLDVGTRVLRGRYELAVGPLLDGGDALAWEAFTDYGVRYLVKTWAYVGEEPDRVQRALWDAELRTLYKLGSSPGASDALVVMRDAGLDRNARCFAMVLEAPGYVPLSEALSRRAHYPWLSNSGVSARRELWSALERIAAGLDLLHERQVLHRDVGVQALFFSEEEGSESLRLGGFEWSVRLGRPLGADPPVGWSTPPERATQSASAWRPDDDWFGFGMLCARLLLDVERFASNLPIERYNRVLNAVTSATRQLTEGERDLISHLIASDPLERLMRAEEVKTQIREILRVLSIPAVDRTETRPYTVVVNLRSSVFVDYLLDEGLREHLGLSGTQTFNPSDAFHASGACTFIQRDFEDALLYAVPNQPFFVLVGDRLILRVAQYTNPRDRSTSWQLAFSSSRGELRNGEGGAGCVSMPRARIAVRTAENVMRDRTIALSSASWEDILPQIERGAELARDLSRFHEFIKATNQIEILLRDAEIFPYEIIEGPESAQGQERITIMERARTENRRVLNFFEIEKGLIEFLQREQMAGKPDSGNVILSGANQDALVLPPGGNDNQWRVLRVDFEQETATLERTALDKNRPSPPAEGVLRSAGMPGQTRLILRRKQAIDVLDSHSYLLRSLAAPGQVYMDTGASDLPVGLDPDAVDAAKRANIEDILRVRPIYALQGPPGTGKTTLAAWLIREILADDPVAQILVTAQAHGAVDVLRARVAGAFADVAARRPLAVRLGARGGDDIDLEDSVVSVALRVLRGSIGAIDATNNHTAVQVSWLNDARAMADELGRHEALGSSAADFVELVKRGANITYCTTSAGELEALTADQSFDWSVIEEAGKAHGFDLALPLQAGHRWLLIGDHEQLPPYRFEDYLAGIDNLDLVAEALQRLPENASGLLDWEWAASWRERTTAERTEFREYARDWLKTFRQVFLHCSVAVGGGAREKITTEHSDGSAAGMLVGQHRMHPDIGELISHAYYDEKLINRTIGEDGLPIRRVQHNFSSPDGVDGKAIMWIDLPWCRDDDRTREQGPYQGKPRYTNTAEAIALRAFLGTLGPDQDTNVELAVLSPYNQQASLLRRRLRGVSLPAGLVPKVSLSGRPSTDGTFPGVHTVDSFQGNQADVVAVSLVRNNMEGPGRGMGFLDESSRLNVLLSRAERLLVLVGSWEFFLRQVSTIELDDPTNPLWHWKKIVTLLDQWFASGHAIRMPADLRGMT
jgi:serine/threonine protein kinase